MQPRSRQSFVHDREVGNKTHTHTQSILIPRSARMSRTVRNMRTFVIWRQETRSIKGKSVMQLLLMLWHESSPSEHHAKCRRRTPVSMFRLRPSSRYYCLRFGGIRVWVWPNLQRCSYCGFADLSMCIQDYPGRHYPKEAKSGTTTALYCAGIHGYEKLMPSNRLITSLQ